MEDILNQLVKQGSGSLEFNVPCGITISPITRHIYIADCCNNRIQVLNPDLTFSHTFGTKDKLMENLIIQEVLLLTDEG